MAQRIQAAACHDLPRARGVVRPPGIERTRSVRAQLADAHREVPRESRVAAVTGLRISSTGMRKHLGRLRRRALSMLVHLAAWLNPPDSPWERVIVAVPAAAFGLGSRRQFAYY